MTAAINLAEIVDAELLQRALDVAAKAGTSLEALLHIELSNLVQTFELADACGNYNYRALLDFALGRIDDAAAMRQLALVDLEELYLLMMQARLPLPKLDAERTMQMAESLKALMP
jgi:hypothetical protein